MAATYSEGKKAKVRILHRAGGDWWDDYGICQSVEPAVWRGLPVTPSWEAVEKARTEASLRSLWYSAVLDTPVQALELPRMLQGSLRRAGCAVLGDIIKRSVPELFDICQSRINYIILQDQLAHYGLHIGGGGDDSGD